MWYGKAVVYGVLYQTAVEGLGPTGADPRHLGARIGATLVLHTWGSAMTHHSHVHGIVPGGGLSLDGQRRVACRPGFLLPVRVLSRLPLRLFLATLCAAYQAAKLQFFSEQQALADPRAFASWLEPLRHGEWVVYAKRTFAGPQAVLDYLSRYTYRAAIALDERGVTLCWKDYRTKGRVCYKIMILTVDKFIRRFLLHALPASLYRIRHYGMLGNTARKDTWRAREQFMRKKPTRP